MKRKIKCNEHIDISVDIDKMLKNRLERKIYAKMMMMPDDSSMKSWLEGVLTVAELSEIELPEVNMLYEAVSLYGPHAVKQYLRNI